MPLKSELAAKGWGDPDAPDYRTKNIVTIKVQGLTMYVHKAVAVIFEELIDGMAANGVDLLKRRDDWSYLNKGIEGYSADHKSWHSVGCAVDINATENVMGKAATTFPREKTLALCKRLGLTWGGTWTSRPDPMHFEWNGTKEAALAKSAALKNARGPEIDDPHPAVNEPKYAGPYRFGDEGDDIKFIQRRLAKFGLYHRESTGKFRVETREAVKNFQKAKHLDVDGIVGPRTWKQLVG